MDQRFKDVKVIAWDLDTTLYKAIPELSLKFKNECIKEVARVKNLSFEKAKEVFEQEREKLGSTILTFEKLKVGDFWTIAKIEERINKDHYIKKDPKLPPMFEKLGKFRHFIITNSIKKNSLFVLDCLGLSPKYFEKIISADDTGKPKPRPQPFKLLFELTGLPPAQHLMIGDMEKVDIAPAKKLGMKTILVWGESKIADLSLPTVYEVVKVLT